MQTINLNDIKKGTELPFPVGYHMAQNGIGKALVKDTDDNGVWLAVCGDNGIWENWSDWSINDDGYGKITWGELEQYLDYLDFMVIGKQR